MTDDFALISDSISLRERKYLTVGGVTDVGSFDERLITAFTQTGTLEIRGEGMKIQNLSTETGSLVVQGESISSLIYSGEKHEKGGFFRKLLR